MRDESPAERHGHDLTMHVFSISAGMIGVCLTAIGILRLVTSQTRIETTGDELLAADALLFVLCCFLSFWSFKSGNTKLRRLLRLSVDGLFMLALTLMVLVCMVIAYAIV